MNFYQLFKIIDAACLGMSKEEYSIILETFLVSDEALDRVLDFEDEDLISKRKKRGKDEYSAHQIKSFQHNKIDRNHDELYKTPYIPCNTLIRHSVHVL